MAVWPQKQLTIRGIGQRPVLIAIGKSTEGKAWPENRLTLIHNTLDFSLPKSSPLRWLPGALQTSQ